MNPPTISARSQVIAQRKLLAAVLPGRLKQRLSVCLRHAENPLCIAVLHHTLPTIVNAIRREEPLPDRPQQLKLGLVECGTLSDILGEELFDGLHAAERLAMYPSCRRG